MNPAQATREAGEAADIALGSAQVAQQSAQQAARDRQRVEDLTPNAEREMIREIAALEGGMLLRIGPKRAMWRDLVALDEKLAEIEMRRDTLSADRNRLTAEKLNAPNSHAAALADWFEHEQKGPKPTSQAAELDEQLADAEAEQAALGVRYDRLLRERAEHIAKRRKPMLADVQKAKEKVAREYVEVIDRGEALRQELLGLRSTEVFVTLFPNEVLASEPSTQTIVGALQGLQKAHLPNVNQPLIASNLFDLLRADARFCSEVATEAQAAAERGVPLRKLTGRVADWFGNGKPDLVGPRFDAAWSGSPEEKREAERIANYTETTRQRVWGE